MLIVVAAILVIAYAVYMFYPSSSDMSGLWVTVGSGDSTFYIAAKSEDESYRTNVGVNMVFGTDTVVMTAQTGEVITADYDPDKRGYTFALDGKTFYTARVDSSKLWQCIQKPELVLRVHTTGAYIVTEMAGTPQWSESELNSIGRLVRTMDPVAFPIGKYPSEAMGGGPVITEYTGTSLAISEPALGPLTFTVSKLN